MGALLNALSPRMRRAAFVLLPAALLIMAGSFLAVQFGFASVEKAGGFLALSFVLLACGVILLVLSLIGRSKGGI